MDKIELVKSFNCDDIKKYGGEFNEVIPDLEKLADLPNPGLLSFLNNNVVGLDVDLRTPLFNSSDRKGIIDNWLDILESNKHLIHKSLYKHELNQIKNIGRYSKMDPLNKRINDIKSYYEYKFSLSDLDKKDREIIISSSFKHCSKRFIYHSIRSPSTKEIIKSIPTNTNSGLPYFTKRNRVINVYDDLIHELESSSVEKFYDKLTNSSCILGWRGQPVDKQRVIWMFPMLLNIIESYYYKPAVTQIQSRRLKPEFIDQDYLNKHITKLFDTKGLRDPIIATDFDRFDQHFNSLLQDLSFFCKNFISNTIKFDEFKELIHYNKFNIPLLLSKDLMFKGFHGMSTGSSGTNMDENYAHGIMQECCATVNGSDLNPYSTVLGDDGILSFNGINVDKVKKVYSDMFGQSINEEKQYVDYNSTLYLQRIYDFNYRKDGTIIGVYPTMRALGRLLGHERFVEPQYWNKETIILRYMSILENCNTHPLFERFVDYIIKGDSYQLGIDIPNFFDKYGKFNVNKLLKEGKIDLSYAKVLEYEFDKSTSIQDWKVFKYLSSKL